MLQLFGSPGRDVLRRLRRAASRSRRAGRTACRSTSCSRCWCTRRCSAAATPLPPNASPQRSERRCSSARAVRAAEGAAMRRTRVLIALATLVATVCCGSVATGAVLPAGFTETTVWNGLGNPTVVRFARTAGRMSPARAASSTSSTAPPTRRRRSSPTCAARSTTSGTAGCSGMALDPQFTTGRPYVYVLYAYDKAPDAPAAALGRHAARRRRARPPTAASITGRLSRHRRATGVETVLIEDFCQQYPSHSVGTLDVRPGRPCCTSSAGDGALFNWADYGQDGSPVNPCGDPRGASPAADRPGRRAARAGLPPPAGPAALARRRDPAREPGHRRGLVRQPRDRRRRPEPPADRRLRLPQPVPLHVPARARARSGPATSAGTT